jgi:hypothetical protein
MRSRPLASPLRAATLIVFGALLGTGRAEAYCREVTDYPPSNYDPVSSGCFTADADGGALATLFWRNACVSYSFQTQGSKYVSMDDAERLAAQAFSTWANAPCNGGGHPSIEAIPFPPVNCNGANGSQEHSNLIIFRDDGWDHDDGANVIGYTTLTVDLTSGEMFGANIEINTHDYTIVTDLADASGPRPGTQVVLDLGTILTHEVGHFLGLAHSADQTAVMFAHYQPNTTTLTPDDVDGICTMYPPGGTRLTSDGLVSAPTCMPTPPLGFLPSQCGSIDSGTASFVASGSLSSDGGADPDPPCTLAACTMGGPRRTPESPWLWAGGAVVASALAYRARRRLRR